MATTRQTALNRSRNRCVARRWLDRGFPLERAVGQRFQVRVRRIAFAKNTGMCVLGMAVALATRGRFRKTDRGFKMASDANNTYKVVINDEEQYSIWFADREPPAGWRVAGKEGTKEECLAHIEEVWTDMRPKSLRMQMDEVR